MKKFYLPALVLLTGALAFSVAGCSVSGSNPYEVATREESANISLSQGETKSQARIMYEEACADGYSKSYVEFLREIGYSGDDSPAVNSTLLSAVEVYAAFDRRQGGSLSSYYVIGAGVFLEVGDGTGDAYVVTNYHILYDGNSTGNEKIPHISDNVTLYLYGGKTEKRGISATYVGGAMNYDVAVLRVEDSEVLRSSDARAAQAADSDEVCVGERVYAVGNPNNKGLSAVSGILSVPAEYITVTAADGNSKLSMLEMRTDAPVNHGNSGGGLFNADGNLIGIVNARSEESGVEHLGYALPSNLVCAVARNIIDNSKTDNSRGALRATLGITVGVQDTKSEYDEKTGKTNVVETVAVEKSERGAAYGKLQVGDVIRSVRIGNGAEKSITRGYMIGVEMFKVRKGDTVTFGILRGGREMSISIAFQENGDFQAVR